MRTWSKYFLPLCALLVDCGPEPGLEPAVRVKTCTDSDIQKTTLPDTPLARQTEHLDIYSDYSVCAGTAVELENHAQFIADELGVELRTHIPLVFTDHPPDQCDHSKVTSLGCAHRDGTVFGIPSTIYHEVGHSVACQLRVYDDASRTVVEGLAVMFDPDRISFRGPVGYLAEGLESEQGWYEYGGHFMRWYYEREGGEALADLYRRQDRDTVVSVVEEMLGVPIDEIDQEFISTSPYQYVPFHHCGMDLPHVEPDADGVWRFESVFDCEDESTMGPYLWDSDPHGAVEASTWMYQSFTIDIDEAEISLGYDISDDVKFAWMTRCPQEHPNDPNPEHYQWGGGQFLPVVDVGDAPSIPLIYVSGRFRVDVIRKQGPPAPTFLHIWKAPWPF